MIWLRTYFTQVQIGFLAVTAVAIACSLLDLPVQIRFPVVLGYLMLVPGYAFVRQIHLSDGFHILMLTLASSIGVSSAVSVAALYLGLWSPNGILIAIGAITILATYGELVIERIQEEREDSGATNLI
jgi:hypothetical protein